MFYTEQNPLIESCCETVQEAVLAWKNGADRIEYCADLSAQGLTPKVSEVQNLLVQIDIPIRPIIRPKNLFRVNASDLDEMIDSIQAFQSIGVEGFVLGMLDKDGRIDRKSLEKLVLHAGKYPITFHKAIDQSNQILNDIAELNHFPTIDYILTSGGQATAIAGVDMILKMSETFKGNIMAGGSVTKSNLDQHKSRLALRAYHGRRII